MTNSEFSNEYGQIGREEKMRLAIRRAGMFSGAKILACAKRVLANYCIMLLDRKDISDSSVHANSYLHIYSSLLDKRKTIICDRHSMWTRHISHVCLTSPRLDSITASLFV